MGRGVKPTRADLSGLDVTSVAAFLADPNPPERLLVLGSTSELAAIAGVCPETAIAFGGRGELFRLFALDPSAHSARRRFETGTAYPADLGVLRLAGASRPFLVGVGAGSLATPGWRMPWAHLRADVEVEGPKVIRTASRGLVVMNGQHWGRWNLAPRGAINDARLEVQVFHGSMSGLFRLRPALRRGLHERSRLVRRSSAVEFGVRVPSGWVVTCDGVRAGRGSFSVTLAPTAVTLLV